MKKIFAFDVDGTITLPRETFDSNHPSAKRFLSTLYSLSKNGDRFAFISGSEEIQMMYQLSTLFAECHENYSGDLRFIIASSGGGKIVDENDQKLDLDLSEGNHFKNVLGEANYERMVSFINDYVAEVVKIHKIVHYDCQVSERGSMINISFPGRRVNSWIAANFSFGAGRSQESLDIASKAIIKEARALFVNIDREKSLREKEIMILREGLRCFSDEIYVCMGGETGFDISPMSATKRRLKYALQHHCDELFFVGDRCQKDQNDEPLYSALSHGNRLHVPTMKKTEDLDRITDKLLEWSKL